MQSPLQSRISSDEETKLYTVLWALLCRGGDFLYDIEFGQSILGQQSPNRSVPLFTFQIEYSTTGDDLFQVQDSHPMENVRMWHPDAGEDQTVTVIPFRLGQQLQAQQRRSSTRDRRTPSHPLPPSSALSIPSEVGIDIFRFLRPLPSRMIF